VRKQKTESELIESIRVRGHWRRPVGAALIAMGACTFWLTNLTASSFVSNVGDVVSGLEATAFASGGSGAFISEAFSATNQAAYLGGKAMAQGTLLGMLLFSLGLIYAFGSSREDELLLRYYDQSQARSEPERG
jgi:hypothetical protein